MLQETLMIVVGEILGPDARYEVVRKFGFGMNSSVWLARDYFSAAQSQFVSIKVLSGSATEAERADITHELGILQLLAEAQANRCLRLLGHFFMPGKVASEAESALWNVQSTSPLHRLGIAHTDLKQDNIMWDVDPELDIPSLLARDPPRLNPPEQSWKDEVVQTSVSQPLPLLGSLDMYMCRKFYIADFGSAQFVNEQVTDGITARSLRAPETILNGPWDEKVDIWTFGCLVFELIVGAGLFKYQRLPDRRLDAAGAHLWQMICFTGEFFKPKQLKYSRRAAWYLKRRTGYLKRNPPYISTPFENLIRDHKLPGLSDADVLATAVFLRRCLRLDPYDRPSAEELLNDPFWVS
ncbi:Serine/threonine-protein kinase SRPK [Grifola frondosa]|uniref:Serine/threonine-protein kinase SRPK n=1 Tax=Grifola frondosa TaxID=5627 RepID=A0A1C7MSV0_GRIFR|nr:Serine/threonine-protein kinase SRPK [Grifola frondosa]